MKHIAWKLFKDQLSAMNRRDQNLTFILKQKDGQKKVSCIVHWRVAELFDVYDHNKKDQTGHILPVFTER